MHDIRAIRENPAAFDAALARRGVSDASSGLLKIDGERRAAILAAETAQAEQNKASKEVGAPRAVEMRRNLNACAHWWPRKRPKLPT